MAQGRQILYQRLNAVSQSRIKWALQVVPPPHVPQQDSPPVFLYMNPPQTDSFAEIFPHKRMIIYNCNEFSTNHHSELSSLCKKIKTTHPILSPWRIWMLTWSIFLGKSWAPNKKLSPRYQNNPIFANHNQTKLVVHNFPQQTSTLPCQMLLPPISPVLESFPQTMGGLMLYMFLKHTLRTSISRSVICKFW